MSFENEKLMNLEDGQLLLSAVDKRKADIISVSDTTPSPVKTLTDGADGLPMGVTVGIEPVQAGSGDPSPENVRPISGWSAVKISRMSNLLDESVITLVAGKSIDPTTGSISNTQDYNYVDDYIPVVENEQYTLSVSKVATGNARGVWGIFYDKSKQYLSGVSIYANTTSAVGIEATFTVPSGARYARFDITKYTTGTLKLAKGTTTDNVTNGGNQYEITIPSTPGTVYGGSLTVNKDGTGKLVVDSRFVALPTFSSVKTASSGITYGTYNPTPLSLRDDNAICVISEVAKPYSFNDRPANEPYCVVRGNSDSAKDQIIFRADVGTTLEQFNEMYAGTNIVYKLATPTEYTLTASQVNALITSLKGVNNLYCDAGDILSVEYSADTKLYVDEHNETEDTAITAIHGMIAESDDPVATESHAIGDVFICNDQLLRATSAIATGTTIAVGTNVEVINLAEYIAEVVSSVSNVQTNLLGRMQDNTEKFMLLNSSNCGEDQTINTYSNQTKVTRHLNHVSFRKLGTSTTYYYVLLYGGDMQVISKSSWEANGINGFTNATPIQLPGSATSTKHMDYVVDVYGENLTPTVANGTSIIIGTYDSANDSYESTYIASFFQDISKICNTVNLSKMIPSIDTNKNFVIVARIRTGTSEGDFWFNLHTVPHDSTT